MNEIDTQTRSNEQWSAEKVELLKKAIQESRINCEADGEDPFEVLKDQ